MKSSMWTMYESPWFCSLSVPIHIGKHAHVYMLCTCHAHKHMLCTYHVHIHMLSTCHEYIHMLYTCHTHMRMLCTCHANIYMLFTCNCNIFISADYTMYSWKIGCSASVPVSFMPTQHMLESLERLSLSWENASIRWQCRQASGAFS